MFSIVTEILMRLYELGGILNTKMWCVSKCWLVFDVLLSVVDGLTIPLRWQSLELALKELPRGHFGALPPLLNCATFATYRLNLKNIMRHYLCVYIYINILELTLCIKCTEES